MKLIVSYLRKAWHWLTSMRTALALLFLLALAAIPGSLLPQRDLNESNVTDFVESHGKVAEIYDKLQLFDVFSSIWFQAIFILLMISLVGCIIPRSWEHYKAWKTPPTRAPKYLDKMPLHAEGHSEHSPEEIEEATRKLLKKWRVSETSAENDRAGLKSFSAERGYARELCNLIFHVALVAILVTMAAGRMVNYEGQVIVVTESGSQGKEASLEQSTEFCNTSTSNYDSFRAGSLFDGTGLHPFCFVAHDFTADYLDNGQAEMFTSNVSYAEGDDIYTDHSSWKDYELSVNHPLRLSHNRVYLQGHGYAPTVTVEWPNGEKRTQTIQFRPDDMVRFLSSGVMRFDPPAGMYPDLFERRQNQIAIQGLFAPTAQWSGENGQLLTSAYPGLTDPALAIDIYRGDAGLDTGPAQSIFDLDSSLVHSGQLQKIDRVNLSQNESVTLDDGTKVTFNGASQFANYQISYDPFQKWVLVSALLMLVSLVGSLVIKRRRIWVRISPAADGGTDIQMGGLARTDRAGWSEEFYAVHRALLELPDPDEVEEDEIWVED
ncbi:cytochrome c biogenesis protein ResB [Corynebacterium striatum]|nr:cytochrome c biogenesis protein ResB [Corynebacterium striatum]HCG2996794.1 cytochrome c biogenesis protein ResB [Corynebacterium striatum]HCG3003084.1 cytochrome c biogenesis protein ResB [Corynebacterium striatum]HCG3005545.1 cytochrome c biogenesis protein ResB [Corynebacterium striatum]HCG3007482.1 cytochrome c biogenesis protein ResB [Corynebacterium striatum]